MSRFAAGLEAMGSKGHCHTSHLRLHAVKVPQFIEDKLSLSFPIPQPIIWGQNRKTKGKSKDIVFRTGEAQPQTREARRGVSRLHGYK
jgi:hypothetical protein